ncbi:MAG: GNAT family N-acetyltransferase [Candidatus Rokubacteria bacterium]|nr:GNAT family N-acetyltransferase [Candidatus Rokubacteria bacterium]
MAFRIRRVESAADFAGLAPAWADVTRRSGQTSPFLHHDWFSCCWAAVAPRTPEVLVVEDGAGAAGFLPIARWTERRRGFRIRCLGLLECPDTPMVDLVTVGEPRAVLDAILAHLAARSDWDVMRLSRLPAAGATAKALEAALGRCFRWQRGETLPSPYLAIEGSWEEFWRAKSQRFKKTCRNIQNRLDRAGRVEIEEHRHVDPASPVFSDALGITSRSWKAERGVAIATMARMPEFFAELTRRASAHGWLSLWLLRLDGRAIAMEYQLRAEGKAWALRADFDHAYRELSPGSALNLAITRALFERGTIHEYDMGPGENDYKLRWASAAHETTRLTAYRRHGYGQLLHLVEAGLVPAARRLRDGTLKLRSHLMASPAKRGDAGQ